MNSNAIPRGPDTEPADSYCQDRLDNPAKTFRLDQCRKGV